MIKILCMVHRCMFFFLHKHPILFSIHYGSCLRIVHPCAVCTTSTFYAYAVIDLRRGKRWLLIRIQVVLRVTKFSWRIFFGKPQILTRASYLTYLMAESTCHVSECRMCGQNCWRSVTFVSFDSPTLVPNMC